MNLELEGSVVLVTGASSGIGRAIALRYAREGARVALTWHSKREEAEKTAELVRAAGGEPLVLRFQLEEESSPVDVIERIRERWGTLHGLINNAVRWPSGFFCVEELPMAEWRAAVHANVDGTFGLIRAALPLMRAAPWGRIVTVSTGLVPDGLPGSAAYTTGKAALHGLMRTLAKELAPRGILCNVLMSGTVASEARPRPAWMLEAMARSASTGRLTEEDEVARAAVFLGSPGNGHITGEAIRVDGLFVTPPRAPTPPGSATRPD